MKIVSSLPAKQMGWVETAGKRLFRCPQEFWAACAKDATYLDRLDVVVTDYNFAPDDPEDGGTFARALRARGYKGLILRASGESDLGEEIEALFNGDVGKMPLAWPEFQEAVAAAKARKLRA